ncbi:hypothetical protein WR25_05426 [Diploscapter pachys]|uniref:C-type lectin domain-containing protein n=1 Tax=Diploscapter pachys TaxID=2018661 RepID=A0A2A2LKY8_9BILA|nr:hypothetical protein WR25_05426 [Diploscapter pachys]
MKRILMFTTLRNKNDIQSQAAKTQLIKDAGFELTIVGIDIDKSLYDGIAYHKFVPIAMSQLSHYTEAFLDELVNDGICFWDNGWHTTPAQICTTSTPTPKPTATPTTKPASTVKTIKSKPTPRPIPEGDYTNCSCNMPTLWVDIMFVIDTSASMTEDGLSDVISDIVTIAAEINFDHSNPMSVRIGVVSFNSDAEVVYPLGYHNDFQSFANDMLSEKKLKPTQVTELNLRQGLGAAFEQLAEKGREKVQKAIFLYSSAYTETGRDNAIQVANNIKESGIYIITLAYVEDEDDLYDVEQLGKLASPRMNLTSLNPRGVVGPSQDALCQVNCFCPTNWEQLVVADRKFGECYFLSNIATNWEAGNIQCANMSPHKQGHLGMTEPLSYLIGLKYDDVSKRYIWEGGITNLNYTDWEESYPKLDEGKCVATYLNIFAEMKWKNLDCITKSSFPMCQISTCDSEHYCPPNMVTDIYDRMRMKKPLI